MRPGTPAGLFSTEIHAGIPGLLAERRERLLAGRSATATSAGRGAHRCPGGSGRPVQALARAPIGSRRAGLAQPPATAHRTAGAVIPDCGSPAATPVDSVPGDRRLHRIASVPPPRLDLPRNNPLRSRIFPTHPYAMQQPGLSQACFRPSRAPGARVPAMSPERCSGSIRSRSFRTQSRAREAAPLSLPNLPEIMSPEPMYALVLPRPASATIRSASADFGRSCSRARGSLGRQRSPSPVTRCLIASITLSTSN